MLLLPAGELLRDVGHRTLCKGSFGVVADDEPGRSAEPELGQVLAQIPRLSCSLDLCRCVLRHGHLLTRLAGDGCVAGRCTAERELVHRCSQGIRFISFFVARIHLKLHHAGKITKLILKRPVVRDAVPQAGRVPRGPLLKHFSPTRVPRAAD